MPSLLDPCLDPLFIAAYTTSNIEPSALKSGKRNSQISKKEQEYQEEVRVFDIYLWISLVMPTGNWRMWLFSLIPVRHWYRRTVCCGRKYQCLKPSQVSWPNGWNAAKLVKAIKNKQLSTCNEGCRRPGKVTIKILLTCVSYNSVQDWVQFTHNKKSAKQTKQYYLRTEWETETHHSQPTSWRLMYMVHDLPLIPPPPWNSMQNMDRQSCAHRDL